MKRWARNFEKCVGCGLTNKPHWAKGYCTLCYPKFILRKTGSFKRDDSEDYQLFKQEVGKKISAATKGKQKRDIKNSLTENQLRLLYFDEKKSLADIAKIFNCSRQYVYKLCLKFHIPLKSKSKARKDAYNQGKTVRYSSLDREFFKKWSNEMAYVLGFIYADGNISNQLNSLSISQKELEPLEKIRFLMHSEHEIRTYKNGLSFLSVLSIGNKEIVDDLLKLGVFPDKSLKIQFPNMQEDFVSHFIRGYFDGDGSICFCKDQKNKRGGIWRASIVTGSRDFLKAMKNHLERLAGVSICSIYRTTNSKAYEIKYGSGSDMHKLFNFFYDEYTLKHNLFLERKYAKFNEALVFLSKSRSILNCLPNSEPQRL